MIGGKMKTAGEVVKEKQANMLSVDHNTTIKEAIQLMVSKKIGAILVERDGQIAGIWTERDLLRNMSLPSFDPEKSLIGKHMSSPLHSASHDTSIIALCDMFLGLFIRHVLIEKEGKYIGLLSIGDVLRASLLEQDHKIKELNAVASWEYYENWGWDRKWR
jgi:signal-transduction protein with cAMP-binding, CBS, and nucleotidyltransferase domain